MAVRIALRVTGEAILCVHHGILEILDDLVTLVLGIDDGVVQVLCYLSGLLDCELVGSLQIAITRSHRVEETGRGREGPHIVHILLALSGRWESFT